MPRPPPGLLQVQEHPAQDRQHVPPLPPWHPATIRSVEVSSPPAPRLGPGLELSREALLLSESDGGGGGGGFREAEAVEAEALKAGSQGFQAARSSDSSGLSALT